MLLAGCATLGSTSSPDWIAGQSKTFPSSRYLVGVGEGDSRDTAEQRALAAIARIFQAEIKAKSRDWESYSVLEKEKQSTTSRRLTLDHVVQVSTNKVLEDAQILDVWSRPNDNRFYVLAGMNRDKAEKETLERIMEWDRTIEQNVTQGRVGDAKLSKIRGYKRAIKYLILREAANSDLRIIRESGQGEDSSYHVGDLKQELDDYVTKHVVIGVEIQGKQNSQIRNAILEGLSREGLLALAKDHEATTLELPNQANNGEVPDLLIKGTAKLWNVDLPDPLFRYARWCSDLEVLEQQNHKIIGIVSRSGREGHITITEARARASKAMQVAVTAEVAETLAAYIYGESENPSLDSKPACPH